MDLSLRNPGVNVACAIAVILVASNTRAASPARHHADLTLAAFLDQDAIEIAAGRQLVDIEARDSGSGARFSGIWYPVNGTTWRYIHVDAANWDDFIDIVDGKDGRWLDVEVGYFNGQKRWSGIFLETGDDYGYEVRTTNDDATFQSRLESNLRAGRQIIDFEAYTENGNTTYAGVWVSDPNEPRTTLYYGLTAAEVNDIFNPQLPIDPASGLAPIKGICGRPIDFERYYSTPHGEYRYAIIMAMYPGHEWAVWFGRTEAEFQQDLSDASDDNTHLIDLEVYESGGGLRYAGIWGDTYKSLHEVDAIPAQEDPEPLSPTLQNLVAQFETPDAQGPLGIVGLYAKNIRSNQSIGYRQAEPFYLASCSKVAIHMKLWQMVEDGLDMTNTITFNKNPWYVEDRGNGLNPTSGLHQNFFGDNLSLTTYDTAMMRPSDNAATSLLVEAVIGREQLNHWLAGVPGVGRGFGLITGITDLDRIILWQGQINNFPNDPSFFLIPTYISEPTFRGMGDVFGDLQTWANANNGGNVPSWSDSQGHFRYYRMGMNTAEPRAFGRLLEKYMDNDFYADPNTLANSLAIWGSGTQLTDNLDGTANFAGFPPLPEPTSLTVYAKNGGKGGVLCDGTRYRVVNDVAIIQKGVETIVMVVCCRDNLICASGCNPPIPNCRPTTASPPGNAIRSFWHARFGYELFSRLIADLKDAGPQFHSVKSTTVSPNQSWWIACRVRNDRGGDALPYKIRFYASVDSLITPSDYLIGTFQTPTIHTGDSDAGVVLNLAGFPDNIPFNNTYFVGWIIDADDEVGEWDDRTAANTVRLGNPSIGQITVELALKAPDFDHDGDVDQLDFTTFSECAQGPAIPVFSRFCVDRDLDFDGDIDSTDFGIFQQCFSGRGVLWDPDCAPLPPT